MPACGLLSVMVIPSPPQDGDVPVSARPDRLSSASLNRAAILDLTQASGAQIEKMGDCLADLARRRVVVAGHRNPCARGRVQAGQNGVTPAGMACCRSSRPQGTSTTRRMWPSCLPRTGLADPAVQAGADAAADTFHRRVIGTAAVTRVPHLKASSPASCGADGLYKVDDLLALDRC
jgi:hypothetical protein